jgi:hypothetical protein
MQITPPANGLLIAQNSENNLEVIRVRPWLSIIL